MADTSTTATPVVRSAEWDAACDRMAKEARSQADANWRRLGLELALRVDDLSAEVVRSLAALSTVDEFLSDNLVESLSEVMLAARQLRKADV